MVMVMESCSSDGVQRIGCVSCGAAVSVKKERKG